MAHPRPVGSPNCMKRTCFFDVDHELPAAKSQRHAQSECLLVPANDDGNTPFCEPKRIRDPHAHDVLCGRGGFVNKHPGNIIFRRVVEANKESYRTCTVDYKALLSKSIVLAMQSQSPPGRFLTRSPGGDGWVEIEDARAVQKTSQALREGSAEEDLRIGVQAESGSTRPSQEQMNNEVLRRALLGFTNGRRLSTKPEVVLSSSQQTENEISNSICQTVVAANVPVVGDERNRSLEADSATIEESTSTKSYRDSSSVSLEETQQCEQATTLGKCLAPGDEAFHRLSDDESPLKPLSDAECIEALQLLHQDHFRDASRGFFPQLRFDMDHGEDDFIAL